MRGRKVCVLGPSGVGKTTLIRAAFLGLDTEKYVPPTIGAAFHSVHVGEAGVKLEVWDTAGQERYAGLVPMYIRGCSCILVCYDASQPDTERITRDIANVRVYSPDNAVLLVGTKSDMCPRLPDIRAEGVHTHIVTSSRTKVGLDELRNVVTSIAPQPVKLERSVEYINVANDVGYATCRCSLL